MMSDPQVDQKSWFEISGTGLIPYLVYGTIHEAQLHMSIFQSAQTPSGKIVLFSKSAPLSAEDVAKLCALNNGSVTGIELSATNISLKTLTA